MILSWKLAAHENEYQSMYIAKAMLAMNIGRVSRLTKGMIIITKLSHHNYFETYLNRVKSLE